MLVRGLIVGAIIGAPVTLFIGSLFIELGLLNSYNVSRYGDPLSLVLVGVAIGAAVGCCCGVIEDARPGIIGAKFQWALRNSLKVSTQLRSATNQAMSADNARVNQSLSQLIVQLGVEIVLMACALWMWYGIRFVSPFFQVVLFGLRGVSLFAALGGLIGLITGQMVRGIVLATIVGIGAMSLLFLISHI